MKKFGIQGVELIIIKNYYMIVRQLLGKQVKIKNKAIENDCGDDGQLKGIQLPYKAGHCQEGPYLIVLAY